MSDKCESCGKFVPAGTAKCTACTVAGATKNISMSTQPKITKFEMPQFTPDDVALWWKQIEARLELANIVDEQSRFKHITAGLPPEVVCKVSDLLFTPPVNDPYQALRERILKEYELSDSAKIHTLLEGCLLGDKKPTTLLREMRKLAQNRVADDTLRELFFRRLPATITDVFRTTGVTDLDKAATAADQVLERPWSAINSINHTRSDSQPIPTQQSAPSGSELVPLFSQMAAQIATLTKAVDQLTQQQHFPSRERSRSRGPERRDRPRASTPRRTQPPRHTQFTECYYHHKFGNEARKCEWWCEKHDEWVARKRTSSGKGGEDH